jgi:hypothetical protein
MNCFLRISLVVPALLLAACGGSGKTTESAASVPAGEAAAKGEAKTEAPDVTPKSESPQPKAQEPDAVESSTPECEKDKDCSIFSDCCTCKAIPAAGKLPQPCDAICGSGDSKCEVKGKTIDNVHCVAGRCKLK